jgi:endoglucanase
MPYDPCEESTVTPETRELLRELSEAFGIPGSEDEVRAIMARHLAPFAEISYDRLGCIIARREGRAAAPRIMLPAHMDEIGLIVRHITDQGFLKFVPRGFWSQVLPAQRWVVRTHKGDRIAVTGVKAPHLLTEEERNKPIPTKDMYLDIGARSRDEAIEMGVRPGDPAAPWGPVADLGNGRLLGKAWDDRAGCVMVIEVMRELAKRDHPNTVFGVGTIQEESGLRGARTSSVAVDPDVALVAEITCANDVPGSTQDGSYSELGKGPAICLYDAQMVPTARLRDFVCRVAEEISMPIQFTSMEGGTTDGTFVQVHGKGVPTLYLGPATRYVHSHIGIMDEADFDQTIQLLIETIVRLDESAVSRLVDFGQP